MYCLTIKYTKVLFSNTVVRKIGKSEIFCKIKHIAQDVMNRRLQNLLSSKLHPKVLKVHLHLSFV